MIILCGISLGDDDDDDDETHLLVIIIGTGGAAGFVVLTVLVVLVVVAVYHRRIKECKQKPEPGLPLASQHGVVNSSSQSSPPQQAKYQVSGLLRK